MADNTTLAATSGGDVIATDDIAGVKYQRVKPSWGVDGAAVDTSVADPMPVRVGDGTTQITVKAASTAAVAGDTALAVALHPTSPLPAGSSRMGMVQITGGSTSSALGLGATVTAYGNLRVTPEPTSLFNDPFDGGAIDVTDRWNTAVVSGFTVTQASGGLTFTTNTTVNNSGYIDSKPTFSPLGLNFTAWGSAIKLEAQASNLFVTNQHRFFGLGDRPTSFAIGTPLKNAVGFEIDTTGQLQAVVYSAGTRVFNTATSLTGVNLNTLITPSNGFVRFGLAIRADTIVFYIGSTEFPAASYSVTTAAFTLPDVQAMPIRFHAINAASAPSGVSTMIITTLGVSDTGGNANCISDGTFNWRRATVKVASVAAVATDTSLVVDVRPGTAMLTASAAMADAFANPTLGKQAVVNMVYNGSTWDLQRGMSGNLTTGDTGAKTATGNGATVANVGNKGVQVLLNLGAVTGTTPTLVLKMQGSVDGGTNWYDLPGATTASLVATGLYGITVYPGVVATAGVATTATTATVSLPLPRAWRVVWTIGGTTPSFTITNIQYNYLPN